MVIPLTQCCITATKVQGAIAELDAAVTAGGLTPTAHRVEDVLVHDIAEDSFEEQTYSGNQVTFEITWTDSGKTKKIREKQFTYSGNQLTTQVTIQYDAAGAVIVGETST